MKRFTSIVLLFVIEEAFCYEHSYTGLFGVETNDEKTVFRRRRSARKENFIHSIKDMENAAMEAIQDEVSMIFREVPNHQIDLAEPIVDYDNKGAVPKNMKASLIAFKNSAFAKFCDRLGGEEIH